VFTVTVNAPAAIPVGSGSIAGRTCFDVAQSNSSTECGELTTRQSEGITAGGSRADFGTTTTRQQTYTFTPSGTVSNVRFVYDEASAYSGQIVQSISGGNTGNNITSALSCTVVYKSDLNTKASGKSRSQAMTVDIYAVYNDGPTNNGTDKSVKLTASIQDCSCCGAYVAAGTWKAFMCHNLGADYSLNPFTPVAGIHGAKYKFGTGIVGLTQAEDQATIDEITGWSSKGGTPPSVSSSYVWDMTNANPCPSGWRVPTKTEWQGVIDNNTFTEIGTISNVHMATHFDSGYLIGNGLFLPAAGIRDSDKNWELSARGGWLFYWSSNGSASSLVYYFLNYLTMSVSNRYPLDGMSIRCIAE
jgi:uncharacterized protein (TIGR02145 family)